MSSGVVFDWVVRASLFNHGQITLPKALCHPWLRRTFGPMDRESRPVEIVNADGTSITGRIRHGERGSTDYFLLESSDPEFADGLREGQPIRIELRSEPSGVVAYLNPPPANA